jgi:heparan sulfate N-deacetylase/N-sulfotransferase NDST2
VKHNQEFKTIFYDQKLSNSILECETNNGIAEVLFFNLVDEIKHVFVGMESIDEIWLLKSLFIDSLRYLTNGDIDIGLTRHVQIDIDDIFVTKMLPEDVHDLIRLQSDLSLKYFYRNNFKFKFVIGYCGRHYQRFKDLHNPSENENKADELFLGT